MHAATLTRTRRGHALRPTRLHYHPATATVVVATCTTCTAAAMGSLFVSKFFAAWSGPSVRFGLNFRDAHHIPKGVRYQHEFVTSEEETELVGAVDAGLWLGHLKSRAQQFFGLVYYQTTHDLPSLQPVSETGQRGRSLDELPPWLLLRIRDTGVFSGLGNINQVAANEYLECSGIGAHVEDPISFGANLATLSLLSPVEITLTPVEQQHQSSTGVDHGNWVKILLEPRSLFILQDDSRYKFTHGIRRSKIVTLSDGTPFRRGPDYRRISLTFRELLDTRRKLLDEHVIPRSNDTVETT